MSARLNTIIGTLKWIESKRLLRCDVSSQDFEN